MVTKYKKKVREVSRGSPISKVFLAIQSLFLSQILCKNFEEVVILGTKMAERILRISFERLVTEPFFTSF